MKLMVKSGYNFNAAIMNEMRDDAVKHYKRKWLQLQQPTLFIYRKSFKDPDMVANLVKFTIINFGSPSK